MIRVGQVLQELYVNEPDGKTEWHEWHVRTIRGKRIYATVKILNISWGKLSKKHGDYGWLDPTPSYCRVWWSTSDLGPTWHGLATTRQGAIRAAIKSMDYAMDEDYASITVAEIIAKLEAMLKREKSKSKVARSG